MLRVAPPGSRPSGRAASMLPACPSSFPFENPLPKAAMGLGTSRGLRASQRPRLAYAALAYPKLLAEQKLAGSMGWRGRLRDGPATVVRADRGSCVGRRAPAWRQHHGADPGQGQDGDGAHLDVRDDRPFGSRAPPAALSDASRDRAGELPAAPSSCRSMPTAATTGFTTPAARRERSRRRSAGRMPGAGSSNWPTSPPKPGAAGVPP